MIISRRIAAGLTLAVAPAVIFLGCAPAYADAPQVHPGPSVSHPAFPHQHNFPQPGSSSHHHHEHNHAE
ncbi:hypothetical protein [Mycobacterium sp. OTB74]|jgi:hypothetical protein|uniref:hypothetical protein n=1 Tax=Mycobacterium sp. OTB74 TaxID=1853452 RepID=UPI00247627CB|nr:hypothetical protein [Mycobacterium sp. OTB74]MDH6245190.1 Spy/CpxP family protein refolding chaperone [Mycobacterium sp. OTB74]